MKRLASFFLAVALALPISSWAIEIQEIESPLGIEAWLVEDHSIPFAAVELGFTGGSSIEPEGLQGATYLMAGLLEEGAGGLDAAEFQEQRQLLATSFSFNVSRESINVSFRFLTENRDESVELLRKALLEPHFDLEQFERVRKQVLSIIASRRKDISYIASGRMNELAFGDHPFARLTTGTRESVLSLAPDDMRTVHRGAFSRGGVTVGAAGDLTPEELGELLDSLLGELPAKAPELPDAPEFAADGGRTVVDFPTPQAKVLFMHEGLVRNDPDFLALYVVNQILGSSGNLSRLDRGLRHERGLTYSTGSFLSGLSGIGLMVGSFASSNESVAEGIEVAGDEWRRMSENSIDEEELDRIKTFLTGAYPLRFDGNGAIAGILAGMQFDDLPASYVSNRNDMVNALTVEEVNRVAARLFKPDDLHFIVVGDTDKLTIE